MRKKRLLWIAAMSMVCSLCVAVGCRPTSSNRGESFDKLPQEEQITLELNKSVLNMVIGDENLLYASFSEIKGESVKWTSSNDAVATVEIVNENVAEIEAITAGQAEITASYGEYTQTCWVSVTQNGLYPILYLQNGIEDNAVIETGGKFNLSSYVSFNGKQFNDMDVQYTVSDPSYGELDEENATFTAGTKTGTISITIEGSWRNLQSELLKKTITLDIIADTVVSVNNGEFMQIELYTVSSLYGNTYKNVQPITSIKVEEAGQPITDFEVSITNHKPADGSSDPVAIWENNKIIANAYGEANFTISIGNGYSISYPIKVERPLVAYTEPIEWFSYLDGELPTYEIFADTAGNKQIIDAYQNGEALTVEKGRVLGVTSKSVDSMSVETIEVYNDKVGFILEVETYAQVIDGPEDLNFMYEGRLAGYVYLKNNVVFQGTFKKIGSGAEFAGVFEGNGYKITYPMRASGFFSGALTGTVRNVWFEITDIKDRGGYSSNALIATLATEGATLENIYVTLDDTGAVAPKRGVCLFESVGGRTTIRNFVADFGDVFLESGYDVIAYNYRFYRHGLLCQYFGKFEAECEYENLYFISSSLKYLSYSQSEAEPDNVSITYAGNDEALKLADSESEEKKNMKQTVLKTVKRYNTVEDFREANNDLSTFDTAYWDISEKYPTWRTVRATVNDKETNSVCLFNTTNSEERSAVIDLKFKGQPIAFTLSVESGNASVLTINGNKITAQLGAVGSAVVAATYQVGGETLKVRFRVEVIPTMVDEIIYWGTENQQAYIPDGLFQAGETLQTITDLETSAVLYSESDGYNVDLLNNSGSEIKQFRAIVKGSKGSLIALNIRSYTRVLTQASDLDFIAPNTSLTGSYLLANNITVNEWTYKALGDTAGSQASTTFNGVFDGNGYTLTFPQRVYGLFGNIETNAIIKNLGIKVTVSGGGTTMAVTTNKGGLLGANFKGKLENMYVEVNGTISNYGIGLVVQSFAGSAMKNVVANYVGDTYNSANLAGDAYKGYLSALTTPDPNKTAFENVYVIGKSDTEYLLQGGWKWSPSTYAFAENEYVESTVEGKTHVNVVGVRRYDDVQGIIDDSSTGKNLAGFDATYWDKESGAPVWRTKSNNQ